MSSLEVVILLGLKECGRKKTFTEILEEANITTDAMQRIELASSLEAAGLIRSVSYQLPVAIRAELTPSGEEVAASLAPDPRKLSKREMRSKGYN